jgi:hypothetical protein
VENVKEMRTQVLSMEARLGGDELKIKELQTQFSYIK